MRHQVRIARYKLAILTFFSELWVWILQLIFFSQLRVYINTNSQLWVRKSNSERKKKNIFSQTYKLISHNCNFISQWFKKFISYSSKRKSQNCWFVSWNWEKVSELWDKTSQFLFSGGNRLPNTIHIHIATIIINYY